MSATPTVCPLREVEDEDEKIRRVLELAGEEVPSTESLLADGDVHVQVTVPTSISQPWYPLSNVTKLNLPNCGLSELPSQLPTALPNLSILFVPQNNFCEVPSVIGQCLKLQMISFKDQQHNQLTTVHPEALQRQLRWLILTNNAIKKLPDTIGRCINLQKCMLSGNQLQELPHTIVQCRKLELIRLASNQLTHAPVDLLEQLPNLRWIGLSDNPFLESTAILSPSPTLPVLHDIDDDHVEATGEILGKGAGGITRKYWWNKQNLHVAVKTFPHTDPTQRTMTSDGLPSEERRISSLTSQLSQTCSALVQVYGQTTKYQSLVLEYLQDYVPLAAPPSMKSCSRDIYDHYFRDGRQRPPFSSGQSVTIVSTILEGIRALHSVSICHGDLYAHNILLSDPETSDDLDVRLTDFGAAFVYDKTSAYGKLLPKVELRAFAVLVQEVIDLLVYVNDDSEEAKQESLVIYEKSNQEDPNFALRLALLSDLVKKCHEAETLDDVYIWWTQKQLASLATSIGQELKLDQDG